ncbi:cation-transporting atpase [Tubulinosema ratisbonensis]|uniref:Cation-transporting atpase n=1 Tax=Tubulinosema ratisbonensis TaxID=291195 RepID=A0A437AKK3_9MICR|nr:cation-transporting atpase [Tubulinosema ratisbonensis]
MTFIRIEGKRRTLIPFYYKKCSLKKAELLKITDKYNRVSYSKIESVPLITTNKSLERYIDDGKVRKVTIFFSIYIFDYSAKKFVQPIIESDNKEELELFYGLNQSSFKNESFFYIIFKNIFKLFFMINLTSILIWFAMSYYYFSSFILVINVYCLLTDSFAEYKSQKSICNLTKNEEKVKIFENTWVEVDSKFIFPGNIILIDRCDEFPCDVKILDGEVVVDESFLTGESFPVVKTTQNHIYSGTRILQSKTTGEPLDKNLDLDERLIKSLKENNKLAIGLVTKTGQETTKGIILKSIIYPPPCDYKFYQESKKIFKFLLISALLSSIFLFFRVKDLNQPFFDKLVIILDMFFVLAYPGLPTSLMFGVSLAQQRLFKKGILCFDKERINTAGLINLIVFDKTGTLTEEGLDVCLIDKMYAEANVKKEEEESEESVKEIEAPTFETEILVKEDNSPKTIYETGSTCEQNIDYVEKMECFEQDFYKEMDNEEFNDYFCSGEEESEEKLVKNENEVDLMDIGMAVCHGAIKYNEEVVGDPLDVKMFVHSKGEMSNDKIVKLGELEIKIIKVVDFNAKVRRMSVLVSFRNRIFIFTKGSPEAIKELLKEISEDYDDRVGEYAMDGYRVISMACLEINSNGKLIDFDSKVKFNKNDKKVFLDPGINFDLNSLNYNTIENYTHKLLGVLVFANTIKPESQGVISELMKANIGCLMATGDNILTSISVANELGILEPEVPLIFPALQEDAKSIYDIEWISVGDEEIIFDKNKLIVYKKNEKINNYLFNIAIEGKEYEFLKQDKNYFDLILEKGKIFARMNPEQKKMLVEDLQNRNVRVCFCGDGANDMAALKEADVGIALAQNEASVASSFTSLITNISAVTTVLKEGRCALISSFSTFKYFFIIIILQFFFYYGLFYFFFNIVSDFQSLHTDLLGTLIISMFVNNLPPGKALSSKKIHDTFFTKKTIRHVLITLIYCLLIISLPFVYCDAPKNFNNESSSLATSLFFIFCTQIIVLGYFFNEGKPHRKCRNRHVVFIIYLSLFTLFTFFLFVSNGKNIICRYFKLVKLPNDILFYTGLCCLGSFVGITAINWITGKN